MIDKQRRGNDVDRMLQLDGVLALGRKATFIDDFLEHPHGKQPIHSYPFLQSLR
jgi:hypothetical protein